MSEDITNMHEYDSLPTIEQAAPADAEAIFDVQRRSWLATYPNAEAGISEEDIRLRIEGENGELIPEKIQRLRAGIEFSNDQQTTFVARDHGEVVGFIAPSIREGKRRVGALYVRPDAQGQGVGGQLLQKAIEWYGRDQDVFLHVATYNHRAIEFYEKYGFVETGTEVHDEIARQKGMPEIPQIEMVLRAVTE